MKSPEGIFCVGVDHHTTPLAVRESLVALAGDRLTPHLIEHGGAEEVVYLSTCNRVEIYGRSEFRGPEIVEILRRAMPNNLGSAWQEARGVYLHEGIACWRHLAEVATGLRSMVMGEGEILAQVRTAYQNSRELGGTRKGMHILFQSSLRAARAARRMAGFGQGDPSVGRCAAEVASEILPFPDSNKIMILGSGHTARSFALAAKDRGMKSCFISSRSMERAQLLASELNGDCVPWERWASMAPTMTILVSALSGGELVWEDRRTLPELQLIVDLGVPRTLTQLRQCNPQARSLDLEELAKRSEVQPEALGAIHRAEGILRKHESLFAWGRALEGEETLVKRE
ncbi:MAG: hypothetical protein EBT69_08665 [Verrucomicrobia bacterium]|nr:hypothetical protein [Verrucomicrobiota bacterium]